MPLCLFPGEDRGPVLEVIVSRTNFISSHTSKSVRVVGLSTALANARDLADWLGIGQVRYPMVLLFLCKYHNMTKEGLEYGYYFLTPLIAFIRTLLQ